MQKRHLGKIFGSVRFVYNEFLKINEELYADGIQKLSRKRCKNISSSGKKPLTG
ncbi:MAG: helix-turn-helix domain-containing protein [Bdellovibrionales bacterium]|nr:helix-turn-helix domain-containing protein [Bdellovibrionales bacterium]